MADIHGTYREPGVGKVLLSFLYSLLFFAGKKLAGELMRFVSDEEAILSGFEGLYEGLRTFLEQRAPAVSRLCENEALSARFADALMKLF